MYATNSGDGRDAPTPDQDAEVYEALRRIALRMMGSERADHTLQATALVHEAWLRVSRGDGESGFRDRRHFTFVATRVMRRVLVDHARARATLRRGGERLRLGLNEVAAPAPGGRDLDLLALDECLRRLAAIEPRQASIVEYRFFGGLTLEEIAEEMGIGARTVDREWASAKSWLHREMAARSPDERAT